MKLKKLFVPLFFLIAFVNCKTKKPVAETTRPLTISEEKTISDSKTKGVVSHKYKPCGSVVIIKSGDAEVILVTFPALDKTFDQDGLTIKFTYRKLRMPVPEGCLSGAMSELKDIEKSN